MIPRITGTLSGTNRGNIKELFEYSSSMRNTTVSGFPPSKRIATNGIELSVHTAGEGKPIVLCHGWPEIAYSWRHQVQPLVDAGYQLIIPNQRGYADSDAPDPVESYDVDHLCKDLLGLLDHFGHKDALFVGHDWGAIVVWNLALMHPDRVAGVINLSVPYMRRGAREWVGFWEEVLGPDFYIVHFNRQPGVADAAFAENTRRLLGNLYRTKAWLEPAGEAIEGMPLISLARSDSASGEPLMSEDELRVFVRAFETSGFTGGLNWYRNFTRNWHLTADYPERIDHPALMIYGDYDVVPKAKNLKEVVPKVEEHALPCGHWIQQECPEETNRIMLEWLARHC